MPLIDENTIALWMMNEPSGAITASDSCFNNIALPFWGTSSKIIFGKTGKYQTSVELSATSGLLATASFDQYKSITDAMSGPWTLDLALMCATATLTATAGAVGRLDNVFSVQTIQSPAGNPAMKFNLTSSISAGAYNWNAFEGDFTSEGFPGVWGYRNTFPYTPSGSGSWDVLTIIHRSSGTHAFSIWPGVSSAVAHDLVTGSAFVSISDSLGNVPAFAITNATTVLGRDSGSAIYMSSSANGYVTLTDSNPVVKTILSSSNWTVAFNLYVPSGPPTASYPLYTLRSSNSSYPYVQLGIVDKHLYINWTSGTSATGSGLGTAPSTVMSLTASNYALIPNRWYQVFYSLYNLGANHDISIWMDNTKVATTGGFSVDNRYLVQNQNQHYFGLGGAPWPGVIIDKFQIMSRSFVDLDVTSTTNWYYDTYQNGVFVTSSISNQFVISGTSGSINNGINQTMITGALSQKYVGFIFSNAPQTVYRIDQTRLSSKDRTSEILPYYSGTLTWPATVISGADVVQWKIWDARSDVGEGAPTQLQLVTTTSSQIRFDFNRTIYPYTTPVPVVNNATTVISATAPSFSGRTFYLPITVFTGSGSGTIVFSGLFGTSASFFPTELLPSTGAEFPSVTALTASSLRNLVHHLIPTSSFTIP